MSEGHGLQSEIYPADINCCFGYFQRSDAGFSMPLLFLIVEFCCPKMTIYSGNIYLNQCAAVFQSECKTEGKRHRF